MNETTDLSVYKEALLFLATAGVIAPLLFRLRISPVLGYLLAGVALGPYGLGSLARKAPWLGWLALGNVETIDRIAAFGVVFLLFTMGLELSFERLRRMRRLVFGLGLAQVVATMLVLTAIALALGLQPAAALTIGGALSHVFDRDRHPGAHRGQKTRRARRTGELLGAAVSRISRSRRCSSWRAPSRAAAGAGSARR